MSKSLKRVMAALADAGHDIPPLELGHETRTAQQAADAASCALDQIAKSVILAGQTCGKAILFVTAGGNQVDPDKASAVAGETLGKADAALIRAQTGFAIGGVAPIGHLTPMPVFMDETFFAWEALWCAAGRPDNMFAIAPDDLAKATNATIIRVTA